MPTTTCNNDECAKALDFDLSVLDVEDSETSGTHTTQYSGSGNIKCPDCGAETEVRCIWDVLNDTGEVLSIDVL